MDGKPTKVAIALLVPEGKNGDQHLQILSDVAVKLMNEDFKNGIRKAKNRETVLKLLTNEKPKEGTLKAVQEVTKATAKKLHILAITACAVGIAHTYMAEEKLLQAGKQLGYDLRVETHGSKGIGTPFTQAEIDAADLVIFATDVHVDNDRFVGKKFYHVPVAKAVKDPNDVINQAIKNGEVLKAKENADFTDKKSKQKAGQKTGVLQHILAGISYMIPVIVLGGIALAFSLGLAKAI
jgi:PTS system fructose-specific IIC component